MGEDPAAIQQEIAATRERLGDTTSALADKANITARVSQKLDAVREETTGRSAREILSAEELGRVSRGITSFARENPIGLAIGAAATGFVIGMLLPATHMEDEKLGEVSDRVKAEVSDVGHEALEHAKEAGHEALTHAKSVGQAALSDDSVPEDSTEVRGARPAAGLRRRHALGQAGCWTIAPARLPVGAGLAAVRVDRGVERREEVLRIDRPGELVALDLARGPGPSARRRRARRLSR